MLAIVKHASLLSVMALIAQNITGKIKPIFFFILSLTLFFKFFIFLLFLNSKWEDYAQCQKAFWVGYPNISAIS
jgi:hypothetical protein